MRENGMKKQENKKHPKFLKLKATGKMGNQVYGKY